jgi:hypothetical protein
MEWVQILTVFAIVATNLTTVIILHCHLDTKFTGIIQANRDEANEILRSIQQEIKDFHARLCVIEERNRGK